MPSLGADMEEGTLLEWLVKPGDSVHRGDIMAVVDTAKAAVEVETFSDGVVENLTVQPGEKVAVGTVLATLSKPGEPAHPSEPAVSRAEPLPEQPVPLQPLPERPLPLQPPRRPERPVTVPAAVVASPLVRHLATERHIDLAAVHGTGRGGRITRADIDRLTAAAPVTGAATRVPVSPLARRLAADAGLDVSTVRGDGSDGAIRAGDVRRVLASGARGHPAERPAERPAEPPAERPAQPVGEADHHASMRQAIGRLMSRSNAEIPHYYLATTVDLTSAMDWLHARNRTLPVTGRLVPAVLLLKATAVAAAQVDGVNGEWRDGCFHRSEKVNLGLVTSLRGGGLMVPVLDDAALTPVTYLMAGMRQAVERARTGRLRASELTGATITVTSLGDQGVEAVYGMIFPPQVAVVGIGAVIERPWAVQGLLGVRPLVTITLAADHRASDGAVGARLLNRISGLLQKPGEL